MLQDHLDKCPFQVVECEFSHVGCQEKVRRCDLGLHLSDNGVHHTALSSKMIYDSFQKMMEEKDRQLQEKDRQLQEKEAQIAKKDEQLVNKYDEQKSIIQQLQERDEKLDELSKNLECLKYIVANIHSIVNDAVLSVTMTEFKHKKDNRLRWLSRPYYTHINGYKMCFEVDFYNNSETSLRIDSYIMPGPYDDNLQWPFNGKVIVQLLNQLNDHHHYDYVFDYKDEEQGKRVPGGELGEHLETLTLPFSRLDYDASNKCQYLKDDCLKFKVIVFQ